MPIYNRIKLLIIKLRTIITAFIFKILNILLISLHTILYNILVFRLYKYRSNRWIITFNNIKEFIKEI